MRARPERRKDGWYVRVPGPDGKPKRKRVGPLDDETHAKAEAFCRAWERRAERVDLWENGHSAPMPVGEAMRAWKAAYGSTLSERTQKNLPARIAMIDGELGQKDLRELTEGDLRAFCGRKLETYAGSTIAGALSILRRVLNAAVSDRILDSNPVPAIGRVISDVRDKGREEIAARDAWSLEEAERIIAKAREAKKPALAWMLTVLFQTGMRRGEVLALQWDDVDFERRRIWLRRASEVGGKGTKVPKTRSSRFVPMSETLAEGLRAEQKRQARWKLRRIQCVWVCPSPKGLFWRERNASRAFETFREKHFEALKVPKLTLHCTRHSFITWALEAGTPTATVSGWCGVSVRVIESNYAHVIPQAAGVEFLDIHKRPLNVHKADQNGRNKRG